jgi:hypothetical protein
MRKRGMKRELDEAGSKLAFSEEKDLDLERV